MADEVIYLRPPRVAPVAAQQPWVMACIKCNSMAVCTVEDGPDFECRECGYMWLQEQADEYNREPEINPDR